MPTPIFARLLAVLKEFRVPPTRPSFANMLMVACGWIATRGQHAVTEALVVMGVAGRRHHEAYHRFFSRGTWRPDALGYWMFNRIEALLDDVVLRVVIDDTLAAKKGPHVFGIGSHLDAVRSTRRHRVFCFGHCWVVLAVLIRVPFSKRTWALPVLFRLYRNLKECSKHRRVREEDGARAADARRLRLLGGLCRVEVAADSAYCNDTVTRGLPASVVLFGSMRPDAVLTELPTGQTPRPLRAAMQT